MAIIADAHKLTSNVQTSDSVACVNLCGLMDRGTLTFEGLNDAHEGLTVGRLGHPKLFVMQLAMVI